MAIFDDFITLKEAGSISGYHPDYIGALIRSKKVKGKKVGKNWFVSKKEVQEHFSTKHYVSAEKVISGRTLAFGFFIFILAVVICGAYVVAGSNPKLAPVQVQSNLSDTVGPQDNAVNQ
jgi:hypothetical protein